MDGLAVIIPIVFLGLAVTGIISAVILKLQRLRLEETRLRAGTSENLAHQVAVLQQEMAELQERVDFAERVLATIKHAPSLPPPQDPST